MIVLCQNCLRIRLYTKKRHLGINKCVCGGEFCGCGSCVDTAKNLILGKKDTESLWLSRTIKKWNMFNGYSD